MSGQPGAGIHQTCRMAIYEKIQMVDARIERDEEMTEDYYK